MIRRGSSAISGSCYISRVRYPGLGSPGAAPASSGGSVAGQQQPRLYRVSVCPAGLGEPGARSGEQPATAPYCSAQAGADWIFTGRVPGVSAM
jgi:hypothetical protein